MKSPSRLNLDEASLQAGDLASVAGALLVLLGIAVIAGWMFGVESLKGISANLATTKINVAVCFIMGGGALLLRRRSRREEIERRRPAFDRWLALMVGAIGLLTLFEHATGIDLGIDELLVADPDPGPVGPPGRMSAVTAGCLALFGMGMALPERPATGALFSALATFGLMISFMVLVGYLYDVRIIYRPVPATTISLHSAIGLTLMFLGALLTRPHDGWIEVYLRPGSIGLVVRMLIPMLVLLPVLVGWLGLAGVHRDLYGVGGQTALVVTASSVLLTAATLMIARRGALLDDALQEQRQIYRQVLGNSLDAFVMIDHDGRIVDWNGQAERIFGWSAEEALGQPLDELVIPPDQRARHRAGLARFLETGEGSVALTRTTMTGCRRNGEAFPAELIIVPIEIGGTWRFGGFVRDVSEQLATEEQLRQSQKMDAIGQLTGGIAHDLNNLLTVVIGNLDLLVPESDPRVRNFAEPALSAAERGASLVHRLLAFSRRQALAPERLELNALVSGVHELIRRTLGEDVAIGLDLADGLWPVFADPGQVESALLNLVVNARDAMPKGGQLTIETSNVHLDAKYATANQGVAPGEYVMLAVSDTGLGMPPHVLEHAFEPFFTTKDVGKGSGLGLSMIYGFAKQSQGHVKIYSEPGHGTTVRLYLPRDRDGVIEHADTSAKATTSVPLHPPVSAAATILVVEDDQAVRGFVTAVLESLGYGVLSAGDAREAMEVLASQRTIDLLFTDVVIPGGMSGRELAETATELLPGLKVLYTSGYTENAIVHQGKLDRGVDFLAKPYRREELTAKLDKVLAAEKRAV